jgi:competence protein ComEC
VRAAARCVAGQHWRWDSVDFEVLHPQAQDYAASAKANAMSCNLRISNALQSALWTGDIQQAQEAQLIAGERRHVDVLVVPHHDSRSSSSAAFPDALQPRIALVQPGYRNRFGHPARSVLVRYQERDIRALDSPHSGAASWQSARPDEVRCQRQQDLRYWWHRAP